MITAKYESNRDYDFIFENIIKDINKTLSDKEDDFLMLCCGSPGTGKSMLGLHALDLSLGKEADVKYIGLNKSDFADALNHSKTKPYPRFCNNDEANISKRDALGQYNRDLIDLYFSIRGLQIFHWWNNPSLDMIDKPFIEERIKGVIFIATKDKSRPRIYYYFRKVDILRIWEKYKNLKLATLKKVCKRYAFYRGWFKDYKGRLLADYKRKKDLRMDEKVSDFHIKYGTSDKLRPQDIYKHLQVSRDTFERYEKELLERLIIKPDEIERTGTNRKLYPKSFLEIFQNLKEEKHGKVAQMDN